MIPILGFMTFIKNKSTIDAHVATKLPPTCGLAKACNVLASPLNKNIFVVRLGRKLKKIDGLRQALDVIHY
jgi:hypothetical protein